MLDTYSHIKISSAIIHCIHGPMQCFQNALTYFAMAVSYKLRMFMKLTPWAGFIKILY
jgi:hypothetical protein